MQVILGFWQTVAVDNYPFSTTLLHNTCTYPARSILLCHKDGFPVVKILELYKYVVKGV